MDFAQEIKQRVPIREALARYGFRTNRHGVMLCPFHEEKTPSFRVYPGTQSYYCFGCGAGGDVIAFVRRLYGLTFQQAMLRIDNDFALGLFTRGEERTRRRRMEMAQAAHKQRERERLRGIYEEQYFHNIRLFRMLCEVRQKAAPVSPMEPVNPCFAFVLHHLEELEHWLDTNLTFEQWRKQREGGAQGGADQGVYAG